MHQNMQPEVYRVIGRQCITLASKLSGREGGAKVACQRFDGAATYRAVHDVTGGVASLNFDATELENFLW